MFHHFSKKKSNTIFLTQIFRVSSFFEKNLTQFFNAIFLTQFFFESAHIEKVPFWVGWVTWVKRTMFKPICGAFNPYPVRSLYYLTPNPNPGASPQDPRTFPVLPNT